MTIQARMDAVGVVVADMGKALAFYRALGMDIPAGIDTEPHVEVPLAGGMRLLFDTEATIASFVPDWKPPTSSGRITLAFAVPNPAAVNDLYARMTAAGYHGELEPFDAFWGQRYATLSDPDGNSVDLFAPLGAS